MIASNVIDIRFDSPKSEDVFFVDTNVWFWLTYIKASTAGAKNYQVRHYPNYTSKALEKKSKLLSSGINIIELIHLIEKTEFSLFCRINPDIKIKDFRRNYPDNRKEVCDQIDISCVQVEALAEIIEFELNSKVTTNCREDIKNKFLDGYDLVNLQIMNDKNIHNIITDDRDFLSIPNINVFTANENVIDEAKKSGKLLTR